jgi:hypothetical protein
MRPIRRALDANRLLTTGFSAKMDAISEKERAPAALDDAITPVLAMQFAASTGNKEVIPHPASDSWWSGFRLADFQNANGNWGHS